MGLIDRLQQLCDKKGVTRYDIAKATGISEATLSRIWAGGTKKPQRKNIEILSQYFNVSTQWLLTGEGEMLRNANDEHPPNESAGTSTMGDMIKIIQEQQRTIRDMLEEMQQLRAEVRKERESKEYYMKLYQQSLEALGKETESRGVSPDEASARI